MNVGFFTNLTPIGRSRENRMSYFEGSDGNIYVSDDGIPRKMKISDIPKNPYEFYCVKYA